MSSQHCLLCLQLIPNGDYDTVTEDDHSRKIRILTLVHFLSLGHQSHKSSYQGHFDEEETCQLCPHCYPVIHQIEEIRNQIALLEEKVERKVAQIRETISSTGKNDDEGDNQVRKLRKIILQVTGRLVFIIFISKLAIFFT